jgi:hypothetical protein
MISIERILLANGFDIVPSLEGRLTISNGDIIVDVGKKLVNTTKDMLVGKSGTPLKNSPENVYRAMSGHIIAGIFPYNEALREEFYAWLEKRGVKVDDLRSRRRIYDQNGYFTIVSTFSETKERVCGLLNTRRAKP